MTSAIFPLNQPAWSLFYEMCANIAHALFFRRKSWIYFGATVLTSGIALAVSSEFLHTMDVGPDRGDTLFAFFRVFFSYFLGNLLFRVWKKRWLHVTLPSVLSAAILLAVLAIRVPGPWCQPTI